MSDEYVIDDRVRDYLAAGPGPSGDPAPSQTGTGDGGMRRLLARLSRSPLTWMARAALADGIAPEVIRAGQGAGPLSDALADRMAEIGGGP